MCEAFAELETQDGTAALSHPEWLALLIDREVVASRSTIKNRFNRRLFASFAANTSLHKALAHALHR